MYTKRVVCSSSLQYQRLIQCELILDMLSMWPQEVPAIQRYIQGKGSLGEVKTSK